MPARCAARRSSNPIDPPLTVHTVISPLTVERVAASAWIQGAGAGAGAAKTGDTPQPFRARDVLGALHYGSSTHPHTDDSADGVDMPLLSGLPPRIDVWRTGGTFVAGRTGRVRWRHNGCWMWGAVELHDTADEPLSLESQAYQAYTDIFAALNETGCPHLQRLWNYLPAINADGGELERYRQFNTGRQQAFLQAGSSAFEGSPAACAIGTHGGPMRVRFLAGRGAPVPVENPRQVSAYRYPKSYGPTSPSFSRAALIDAGAGRVGLLISGTASIVGHQSMHAGNVAEQTRETLRNLQAVIDAAHAKTSARFAVPDLACAVYVRRSADAPQIAQVLGDALGADAPMLRHAVHLEADICRSDLLVEIEAHQFSAGELRP
jgi:chorismate lyase / 3-hydroxybenzoate synthase